MSVRDPLDPSRVPFAEHEGMLLGGWTPISADQVLEALPVAVYTTDRDGRITFYNRAAADLWGCEPELGKCQWCGSWRLYWPDGRPMRHDECPMAVALKEARPVRGGEAMAERPDGSRISFLAFPTPLFDKTGNLTGAINTLVNISDRRRAEEMTVRQAQRLEALNRIAKSISKDLDLPRIVQAATDSATKLIGAKFGAFFYNVTDDRGETYRLFTLSGAPREAFEKFGMPRNTAIFGPTFRGQDVVRSDDIRKDPRYGKNTPHQGMPQGHPPVVSYLAAPVVSRFGKVHGGLFFAHDQAGMFTTESEEIVTAIAAHAAIAIDNANLFETAQAEIEARKHTERAARQLAAIVESSHDAIVSKDLDGIVASWNKGAEELFGYSTEEMVGQSITILIPADRQAEEADILERIRCGERIDHFETVRRRKDGSSVDVSLVVSPIIDRHGKVIGASKIARDITARKRIEAMQTAHRKVLELTVQDAPIADVLDMLVQTVEAQSESGSLGSILLVEGDRLRLGAAPNLPEAYNAAINDVLIGPETGSCGSAAHAKSPIFVSDIATDPRWRNFRDLALSHGLRACWSTPIMSGTNDVLGTFAIYYREPRQPAAAELELVHFVTYSAALVIERKRAQEQRNLLLREMNHRVKNLFAIAGGIVGMSARGASSPEAMAETVRARLGALARAHDLVRPAPEANGGKTDNTTLSALVGTVMSPYLEAMSEEEGIVIKGCDVALGADAATSMALVLHELATNAAKYGALSLTGGGRVHVEWSVKQDILTLEWREEGGPVITGPPERRGFGSQLSHDSIEGQLRGRIVRDWRPEGLVIKLVIPLDRLTG